jgi:hypothetical protein
MCLLRLENNLLTVGRVCFTFKIIFLLLTMFALFESNFFLSNVFASLQNNLLTIKGVCFAIAIEENAIIKAFVRYCCHYYYTLGPELQLGVSTLQIPCASPGRVSSTGALAGPGRVYTFRQILFALLRSSSFSYFRKA